MQETIVRRGDNDTRGLLSRLRRNTAGNTIAMIAMATIPLAGMVGSAVDIGRSYLIKSRLQQGCDAGVLAARRAMAGSTLDAAATTQAQNFFRTNFANDTGGATNVTFTPAGTADGQVTGTATARVPMSITKVFGTDHVDLSVQCDARLEVSNIDVMMVLDVTGSMACRPDNSNCDSGPQSKIVALRRATVDFHQTILQATANDSRYRIGFVPYSSTVNMGQDPFTNANLLPDNWLVDNWTYQSRVANMNNAGYSPTTTYGAWTNETYGSSITNQNCTRYGRNEAFSGFNPAPPGNPNIPTNDVFTPTAPASVVQTQYERVSWTNSGGTCVRRYRSATTVYAENGRYGFTNWDYKPVAYNVNAFKTGNVVNAYIGSAPPTGTVTAPGAYNMVDLVNSPGSTVTASATTFDGCVEERDTVAQATYSTIPSGAFDMDILTTPYDDATRWRPMWQELIYDRAGVANELNSTTNRNYVTSSWCPVESSHLAVRNLGNVQSYVNTFEATGNTFHDLGMAWGARMLSPTGMWAAQNSTAPNGRAITRHLIFMTDGDMFTPPNMYNSHGYEKLDRRVWGTTGGNPDQNNLINRHNSRFVAICNAARANNIMVWTVAFGTSNPPNLVACADPGRAFQATNAAALQAQFQNIASQIAALRISR